MTDNLEKKAVFAFFIASAEGKSACFWKNIVSSLPNKQCIMTIESETKRNEIIDKLSMLWNPLTEEQIDVLRQNMVIRHYEKGEYVYKEHEIPRDVMCLVDGKVKITKTGISGQSVIIRVIKPWEFIGFRAIAIDDVFHASAITLDASVVAFFPEHDIHELIMHNPSVSLYFIKSLAELLGVSDQRIVNRTQKHIRARLAESLLLLKIKYGTEKDGKTLLAKLNREDLANMSNMTTSNAIRTLSAFAEEGLVTTESKKIVINDEEELIKISNRG